MDFAEDRAAAPRFTRWVRSLLLGTIEGVSLGLAIGTVRVSAQLLPLVTTNRPAHGVRQAIISSILTCALLVPSLVLASCASPRLAGRRLQAFEVRARLLSPLCSIGFVPLLIQSDLWKGKTLAFLIMTAVFSVAVTLSTEAALVAASSLRSNRCIGDLAALASAARLRISAKASLLLSASTITLLALYGLVHTFAAAKSPIPGAAAEWAVVQKVQGYKDASLWFTGIGTHALGHASILGAVYSAWSWVWPKAEGLYWLRLFAVTWPALPLLAWTRKSVGATAGWFIAAAYLSLPAKALLTASDTFPVAFAVGLLFLCGYFFEAKRIGYALLLAVATVAVHERAAAWVVTLGLLFAVRDRNVRWGAWLSVAAAAYFVYAGFFLLPRAGVLTYAGGVPAVPGAGSVIAEHAASSLVNPAYAIPRWLDSQTFEFWLVLLLPLGWLPLRNSLWFAWLLPSIVVTYLARLGSDWHTSTFTQFAVVGIVSSIVSLGRLKQGGEASRARYLSVYAGWLAALLPCALLLGTLWYSVE